MDIVEYARQGDIKVDRIERLPEGLTPRERMGGVCIVAYGEQTGHRHYLKEEHVQLYANEDRLYMVIAGEPATLWHEEHDPIVFAPGIYEIRRQREWSDTGQPVRVCG
ncbi:MAG: hypothetical protein EPN97_04955 [Alphaproteobacteria bacterium]|nr:MAG: hypothetical protein EPN97_04955 [Alphaproteobacteria bacterium]